MRNTWADNHDKSEFLGLIAEFSRLTPARWIQAAVGITTILLLGGIERDPAHPYLLAARVGFDLGYALTMWSLVFLTIGVFRKLCPQPNAFVRYVADSSYWMYLIHLPVVIWLQVAFAELPLHWSLKLAAISAITIALALLTYDLFVRSTFIGQCLNGRRRERVMMRWAGASARHLNSCIRNSRCCVGRKTKVPREFAGASGAVLHGARAGSRKQHME